jgi:hypothetical protein
MYNGTNTPPALLVVVGVVLWAEAKGAKDDSIRTMRIPRATGFKG